jgi:hypothetical protein
VPSLIGRAAIDSSITRDSSKLRRRGAPSPSERRKGQKIRCVRVCVRVCEEGDAPSDRPCELDKGLVLP